MERREFCLRSLKLLLWAGLLEGASSTRSFAHLYKADGQKWLQPLIESCDQVKSGKITHLEWQQEVDKIFSSVDRTELLKFIDFEKLTGAAEYYSDHPTSTAIELPDVDKRHFERRIFGMKRGVAVVPHAHNNMVSAHLVVQGSFRLRTFDRLRDEEGLFILKATRDQIIEAGSVITMSQEKDNVHWFIAESDYAFTFNISVPDVSPVRQYINAAENTAQSLEKTMYRIYVDPTVKPSPTGEIKAPIISEKEAHVKFGGQPLV